MEMFEDGGLKDEGGMIDEVSGNDVPSGSTREEVRDDIPAQLSEGEFVFPADVVRFIGLEKLMTIRQKAKMGLQKMEDMGQMGNSDEATMPDDMPFDINDLDMQEDVDSESEMEYNRGGVVRAAVGTYVAPNVPVAYNPMNTTNQMTGNPTQMQQPTAFTNNAYASNPQNMYSPQGAQEVYAPGNYKDLLGTSAGGAPQTENVRYFNAATGQTRTIPHVLNADGTRGDTIYPIPEGFVMQEEAPKEEAKKTTKVQSTKVAPVESGDGGDGDNISTLGGATMDVGGREFALGYNFDGSITLTDPKTMESKTYDKDSQITKDAKAVTMGQIVELSKLTPAGIKTALVTSIADKLDVRVPGSTKIDDIKRKQQQAKNRLNKTFSGIGDDPSTGMSIEDMDTIQAELEEGVDTSKQTDISKQAMQDRANKQAAEQRAAEQKAADARDAQRAAAEAESREENRDNKSDNYGGNESSNDSDPGGGYGDSSGSMGGMGDFNTGGLAGKKKKKLKVKRMKRGGLASR